MTGGPPGVPGAHGEDREHAAPRGRVHGGALRAGGRRARRTQGGRGRLPRLPPARSGHADRFRRRQRPRPGAPHRRAARRPGGPAGQALRRPAGRVLDRALDEAGIDPDDTYVTNAVKHFKFAHVPERGKRRIHKAPTLREATACKPWLDAEVRLVDPDVLVALGATAGKALLGSSFRVTRQRGILLPYEERGDCLVATIHPSAVLRAGDRDREAAYAGLVSDLAVAAEALR